MLRPPRARFTPPLLLQTHSPRRAQPCTHIPPRRPSLDRVPRGRGMRARTLLLLLLAGHVAVSL